MATNALAEVVNDNLKEVYAAREILGESINGLARETNTRFNGLDALVKVLEKAIERVPALIKEDVSHLERVENEKFAIQNEKFGSVQNQFIERDTRAVQTKTEAGEALHAALTSQKEAVAKTETAFTKQIDNLERSITSLGTGLDGKIDDLKEGMTKLEVRIQAMESIKLGANEVKSASSSSYALIISLVVAVVTVAVAVVAWISHPTSVPVNYTQPPASQQGR